MSDEKPERPALLAQTRLALMRGWTWLHLSRQHGKEQSASPLEVAIVIGAALVVLALVLFVVKTVPLPR